MLVLNYIDAVGQKLEYLSYMNANIIRVKHTFKLGKPYNEI
jgi:hypothetical protein